MVGTDKKPFKDLSQIIDEGKGDILIKTFNTTMRRWKVAANVCQTMLSLE